MFVDLLIEAWGIALNITVNAPWSPYWIHLQIWRTEDEVEPGYNPDTGLFDRPVQLALPLPLED